MDVSVSYHELDIGGESCEAGETNRGDDGSRLGESRFAPGTKYPMTLVVTLTLPSHPFTTGDISKEHIFTMHVLLPTHPY